MNVFKPMEGGVHRKQGPREQIGFDKDQSQQENFSRFEAFLQRELHGRNRKAALKSFRTEQAIDPFGRPTLPDPLDLVTVAFTHDHHWRHRKSAGTDEDPRASMGGLTTLFRDMESACRQLAGNARAFRASAAAKRWIRPDPQIGSPVYSFALWDFDIPELWGKANADQLLGSSLGQSTNTPSPDPPLLTQLQDLAALFSALDSAANQVIPLGAKTPFDGEQGRLIEQMHFNCLTALHGHGVDESCLRGIAKAIHWWVTGEEPTQDWGKRQATQARAKFKAYLERTSGK